MVDPYLPPDSPWRRLRRGLRAVGCSPAEVAALAILAAAALCGMALLWWLSRPAAEPATLPPSAAPAAASGLAVTPSETGPITVHVAGEVVKPGLYELTPDSRVADALAAAGGTTARAVVEAVNLARPLTDGEQLLIPAKGESPATSATATGAGRSPAWLPDGRLSLSSASAEDLEELPGIGPVLAERIIAHRDSSGGFSDVAELNEVPGIGELTYAELAELVAP